MFKVLSSHRVIKKKKIPNGEKKGRIDSGNKSDYHDNHNNKIVPTIESSQILRRLSPRWPPTPVSVNIFRLAKRVQERRVALQGIETKPRPRLYISKKKSQQMTSIISKHVRVRPSRKKKGTLVLKEETVMSIINEAMMNVIDLARFPFNVEFFQLPS